MVQIKTVETEYVGRSIFHDEMACGRLIFFSYTVKQYYCLRKLNAAR